MIARREDSSDLLIHTSGDHQCRRCVNVMSSVIPTTVTEIALSRVDLLGP
jgi:hypothetical protein